jgi:hypothetical protein
MELNQLVLSKYLFQCGQNELSKNTPLSCGLAISLCQDSVELLARTIANECDARVKKFTPFPELWGLVRNATGNSENKALPLKGKMLRLNDVRVSFKHGGHLPDMSQAQGLFNEAENFLRQATRRFFDKDFDKVSLVDLIRNGRVKQAIKDAETCIEEADFEGCLNACAKAEYIVSGKIRRVIPELPSQLLDFGHLFDRAKSSHARAWVRILASYLEGLRQFPIAIALKLNLSDYTRFHAIAPDAVRSASGNWQFNMKRHASRDDAEFCVRYVTDYALAMQAQFEQLIKPYPTEEVSETDSG